MAVFVLSEIFSARRSKPCGRVFFGFFADKEKSIACCQGERKSRLVALKKSQSAVGREHNGTLKSAVKNAGQQKKEKVSDNQAGADGFAPALRYRYV
jgi:hypothetical protein